MKRFACSDSSNLSSQLVQYWNIPIVLSFSSCHTVAPFLSHIFVKSFLVLTSIVQISCPRPSSQTTCHCCAHTVSGIKIRYLENVDLWQHFNNVPARRERNWFQSILLDCFRGKISVSFWVFPSLFVSWNKNWNHGHW